MAVVAYMIHVTLKKTAPLNIPRMKNCTSRSLITYASKFDFIRRVLQVQNRKFSLTRSTLSENAPDYYSALGIRRSADLKTIKLAYFNLAKKFHPDTNKSEEARFMFQFVAEAYDVLSDERKRANYDEFGTVGEAYGGKAGGPQRSTGSSSRTYDSEELFLKLFGEADGRKANAEYQAEQEFNDKCDGGFDATRELVLPISFEDATRGCITHVDISLRVICIKCKGSKSEWGYQSNVCPYCEGTGIETEKIGHILTTKTCYYCDGSRLFNKFKCNECAGTGQMIMPVPQYEVTIPPGSVDGQFLKVVIDDYYLKITPPEQPKHFYVKLAVEKSRYFKRDGHDIYTANDISVSQALLGGELSIKGLYSSELTVPLPSDPNIESSHKTLVAPGEGVFMSNDLGNGHHFVEVGIKVPQVLTEKQKTLLLKLFASEEQLINGTVNNGVEYPDSHRYQTNVIEPSKCERKFSVDIQ